MSDLEQQYRRPDGSLDLASTKVTLAQRYLTDPLFHALVEGNSHGWADDDGNSHNGPTVADAVHVEGLLLLIGQLGYSVVPSDRPFWPKGAPAPRVRCPECEHEFTLGDS